MSIVHATPKKLELECEDETVEESRAPEEAWALLVDATLVPISPNSQVTPKATSLYTNPDSNRMFQIQLTKQVSIPRLYHRKNTQKQHSELQKASSSSISLSLSPKLYPYPFNSLWDFDLSLFERSLYRICTPRLITSANNVNCWVQVIAIHFVIWWDSICSFFFVKLTRISWFLLYYFYDELEIGALR